MDPYQGNPLNRYALHANSSFITQVMTITIHRKFRNSWPWEQDRQMALYHRTPEHIQIASHPDSSMLETKGSSLVTVDWCLSHLPQSGCFIAHHCANPASKQRMIEKYNIGTTSPDIPFAIHPLKI
jgi:hypothetical protein